MDRENTLFSIQLLGLNDEGTLLMHEINLTKVLSLRYIGSLSLILDMLHGVLVALDQIHCSQVQV